MINIYKRISPYLGRASASQSGDLGPQVLVSDGFTRADSNESIGAAPTGQVWVPNSGVWGITNGQAFLAGFAAQATCVVDSGASDIFLQFTFNQYNADAGVCFRSTDDSNHFISNRSSLFRREAGVFTKLGDFDSPFGSGDVLSVITIGSNIGISRNGVGVLSVEDSFNSSATHHGFRSNNDVNTYFDDFLITRS